MKLQQLSDNGYTVTEVFDAQWFDKIYDLCKNGAMKVDVDGREKFGATGQLYEDLRKYFEPTLKLVTPDLTRICGMELWRDPPGYTNSYHKDDPALRHIMIVYLETNADPALGTGYIEADGTEYKAQYIQNQAMMVLNSNKIVHGLVGRVPAGVTRYTFYLNWI